eukprot:gene7148-2000_t
MYDIVYTIQYNIMQLYAAVCKRTPGVAPHPPMRGLRLRGGRFDGTKVHAAERERAAFEATLNAQVERLQEKLDRVEVQMEESAKALYRERLVS